MDDWNKKHHGGSGLVDRVKASTVTDADAEAQTIEFINKHVGAKERPVLAGNSIHQDRRFIRRYMPALDEAPALPDGRRLDDQGARAPLVSRS